MKRFSRLLRSNSLLEERLLFPTNFPIPFSPNYYLWKIRYVVLLVLSFFLSWKKWKGKWKFSKRAQFFLRESLPRIGISSIIAWNKASNGTRCWRSVRWSWISSDYRLEFLSVFLSCAKSRLLCTAKNSINFLLD